MNSFSEVFLRFRLDVGFLFLLVVGSSKGLFRETVSSSLGLLNNFRVVEKVVVEWLEEVLVRF